MVFIIKIEHLEHFTRQMGTDYVRDGYSAYGKSHNVLSTGQKCELLNSMLLSALGYQGTELSIYETSLLARFLYETFPPQKLHVSAKREKAEPLHSLGALFDPSANRKWYTCSLCFTAIWVSLMCLSCALSFPTPW